MAVRFDQVSLGAGTKPFSFSIGDNQGAALFGPAGGGKTHLLDLVRGKAKPYRGTVSVQGKPVESSRETFAWRSTPQSIAKRLAGRHRTSGFSDALSLLGLWEVRKDALTKLSPSQLAACAMLPLLVGPGDLLLSDGGLDALDPWVRGRCLEALAARCAMGATLLITTNQEPLALAMDQVILMSGGTVVMEGTTREILKKISPSRLLVEVDDASTVLSICEPFEVEIEELEKGWLISARDGQSLAAKLLTQGYGTVRVVKILQPSLLDAFDSLTFT